MLPFYIAIPRYIIPLQVFLVGPLILLASFFARRASTILTYGCIAYAGGSARDTNSVSTKPDRAIDASIAGFA
jgi:hypothetical protein